MAHPDLESAIDRRLNTMSQPKSRPSVTTGCVFCAGTGTIVTRYGGPDGMFPDEDYCFRCNGAGYISPPSDNTAAEAA